MTLAGRHAIVTGGGTGIGAAIAAALEAEGATVSRIGRRPEKLGEGGFTADVSCWPPSCRRGQCRHGTRRQDSATMPCRCEPRDRPDQ